MKYLCLFYGEEQKLDAMSKPDADRLTDDCLSYDDVLAKSGHLVLAQALQSVRTATSVRVRDDEVDVFDGPFSETKEQLLGFILIEAKDKNDAINVASNSPLARLGTAELRPVLKLRED
jgi:hypothetical protein